MSSNVAIANLALTALGAARITSLTDATENARKVNAIYDLKRQQLLAMYPWNFATKRETLAVLSTQPEFQYTYAYQLPSDCLKVWELNKTAAEDDASDEFKIEGRTLLTDADSAQIKYTSDEDDAGIFSPAFVMAFAAMLEAELAYALTNKITLKESAEKKFLAVLSEAKSIDAQEGVPTPVQQDDLLDERE